MTGCGTLLPSRSILSRNPPLGAVSTVVLSLMGWDLHVGDGGPAPADEAITFDPVGVELYLDLHVSGDLTDHCLLYTSRCV